MTYLIIIAVLEFLTIGLMSKYIGHLKWKIKFRDHLIGSIGKTGLALNSSKES
jgi:hypothetical protein